MKGKCFVVVILSMIIFMAWSLVAAAAIVPDATANFDSATDVESTGWYEFQEEDAGEMLLVTEGDGKYLRYVLGSEPYSWITPTLNIYEFIKDLEPEDYDFTIRFDVRCVVSEGEILPAGYTVGALIRGISDADLNSFIVVQGGGNRYSPMQSYVMESEAGAWTTCEYDVYVEKGDFRGDEEIEWDFCLFSNWIPSVTELHLDNFQIIDNNAPEPTPTEEISSVEESESISALSDTASSETEDENGDIKFLILPAVWIVGGAILIGVILVSVVIVLILRKKKEQKT